MGTSSSSNLPSGACELYDLVRDPEEDTNIAAREPDMGRELKGMILESFANSDACLPPAASGGVMIIVRDLVKHYDGGLVKALNGISFEVEKGEVVSIMGPSGCAARALCSIWWEHSTLPRPERS